MSVPRIDHDYCARTTIATLARIDQKEAMSEIPSFISVCGLPSDTDIVEVEPRAEAILIRQGWTPPAEHFREVLAVHEGYGVEAWCPSCMEHWPCKASEAAA